MNQKDLAAALGLDESVVSRYKRKGMPTHSVEAARQWKDAHIKPRARASDRVLPGHFAALSAAVSQGMPLPVSGMPPAATPPTFPPLPVMEGDEDFQAARTRREIAEANLAEKKDAELQGKLIQVGAVRAVWARRMAATRDAILQIPIRVAPVLAAETSIEQVSILLEAELRQALAELTRDGVPRSAGSEVH